MAEILADPAPAVTYNPGRQEAVAQAGHRGGPPRPGIGSTRGHLELPEAERLELQGDKSGSVPDYSRVSDLRSSRCLIAFDGAAPYSWNTGWGTKCGDERVKLCVVGLPGEQTYGSNTHREKDAGAGGVGGAIDREALWAPNLRLFIRISMRSIGALSQWHSRIGSSSSALSGVARADQIAIWTSL